jgi:glycosyltransferase involved in cell wall biosynthesis
MRIAMVSTPFVKVPPAGYGGTELIVAELVAEFARAGEEVILYATGDSQVSVELRAHYPEAVWPPTMAADRRHLSFVMTDLAADLRGFDVVHFHSPAALPVARLLCPRSTPSTAMVCTVHHARDVTFGAQYASSAVQLVAVSRRQRILQPGLERAAVVHHGLDHRRFTLGQGRGGYVAFLGRFSRDKGLDVAIDCARAAGVPIRIAGRPHPEDEDYFERELAWRLRLPGVEHLGELGGAAKVEFLGEAAALLFPIDWEEPFGLVLIESMLCGTPVLAFARGSVAELLEEGATGTVCRNREQLTQQLARVFHRGWPREHCRARAIRRFSSSRMARSYLELYRLLVRRDADATAATIP